MKKRKFTYKKGFCIGIDLKSNGIYLHTIFITHFKLFCSSNITLTHFIVVLFNILLCITSTISIEFYFLYDKYHKIEIYLSIFGWLPIVSVLVEPSVEIPYVCVAGFIPFAERMQRC